MLILPLLLILCLLVLLWITWQAYRYDPYFSWTKIKLPFLTKVTKTGTILLTKQAALTLVSHPLARAYALFRTGIRIPLYNLFFTKERKIRGTEFEIIQKIHHLRFNPNRPYVITGSHYSDLYMRNMGVFFNALLDSRLTTNQQDWDNRQRVALQTIAYDLEFLKQNIQAVTTIVPLGNNAFTGLNIYKHPSDALFAVLYSLKALTDESFIPTLFPAAAKTPALPLKTKSAATKLLASYRAALTKSINHYLARTIDPKTGLVCRNLPLSSARDGVKRDCSFYDNVIAWATVKLATDLHIPHQSQTDLRNWRQTIIDTYWDAQLGIFRDDLNGHTVEGESIVVPPSTFSADSLIVTSTGFLDYRRAADRSYLVSIVNYIQNHQLDQPFPLRYAAKNSDVRMHGPVRWIAPSYMGKGIWSHWGMEYIKVLLLLSQRSLTFRQTAKQHLASYKENIERFGGYPELYSARGKLFKSSLLRGVLRTGWVVNYEQAKMMAGLT